MRLYTMFPGSPYDCSLAPALHHVPRVTPLPRALYYLRGVCLLAPEQPSALTFFIVSPIGIPSRRFHGRCFYHGGWLLSVPPELSLVRLQPV